MVGSERILKMAPLSLFNTDSNAYKRKENYVREREREEKRKEGRERERESKRVHVASEYISRWPYLNHEIPSKQLRVFGSYCNEGLIEFRVRLQPCILQLLNTTQ